VEFFLKTFILSECDLEIIKEKSFNREGVFKSFYGYSLIIIIIIKSG
jgi:hypothetical protein